MKQEALDKTVEYFKGLDLTNPVQRAEAARKIVDVIETRIAAPPLTQAIADVKNREYSELVQYRTEKGRRVYILVPGSYTPSSQLIVTDVSPTRVQVSARLAIPRQDIRNGRVEDIRRQISKMLDEIDKQTIAYTWNQLKATITSTDSNYTTIDRSVSTWRTTFKLGLKTAFNWVEGRYGDVKVIAGRASALDEITEFAGYSEATKEEIDRQGYLGKYRGRPLQRVVAHKDEWGNDWIDGDNIFVIADNAVKVDFYGQPDSYEDLNSKTQTFDIHVLFNMSSLVVEENGLYRINFSGTSTV